MDIVDSHAHVISDDTASYPPNPIGGKPSAWAAQRPIVAERMVELMDAAGVDQAVLVQATTAYSYDNRYVIDCTRRWPDRFVAVGTFEPTAPGAAGRLGEALDAGLSGVRLFTTDGDPRSEQGLWFSDEATDEFWAAASERRVPVCLQLRLGEATLPALERVLRLHPDLVLLLDHCGYPDVRSSPGAAAAQLAALAGHPGLHLKLTHRTLEGLRDVGSGAGEFLDGVLNAFGPGRIAWGSNCPAAEQPLGELVELADDVLAPLSEFERGEIFAGTARRLYSRLAATV